MKEIEVKAVYSNLLSCNVQVRMYSAPNVDNGNVEFEVLTSMSVKNIVCLEAMACVLLKFADISEGHVLPHR